MMQQVPENIESIASPGGAFALRWDPIDGTDIQQWQLLRCDYPISARNAAGLLSGGMDLMLTRWELHPSCTQVVEDTGVEGKHYCVLGQDSGGQVHFPAGFAAGGADADATRLSKEKSHQGWVKGVKGKDKYSKVF